MLSPEQIKSLEHVAEIMRHNHPDISQRIEDYIKAHGPQPAPSDIGGVHQVFAGDSGSGKDK